MHSYAKALGRGARVLTGRDPVARRAAPGTVPEGRGGRHPGTAATKYAEFSFEQFR